MPVIPTIGEIMLFAGRFEPSPWLFCDGRLLPINQYLQLYDVIGTTYGGDGWSNFAIPDLRGRFPMGQGQANGTMRHIGEAPGLEAVYLTPEELPSHSHQATARGGGQALSGSPSGKLFGRGNSDRFAPAEAGALVDMVGLLANEGGWTPHENRQPALAVSFVIAHQGISPSRG